MDGFLREWDGIPGRELAPGLAGLQQEGTFTGQDDVRLVAQAVWDEDHLYLALTWTDNNWDVEEVTRRDAVWVDPQKKRRDRMLFFDYFKFHMRASNYDYTLWLSPQTEDKGPFFWARLLEGYRGTERATGLPVITSRPDGSTVTVEIMLTWKELKLKPNRSDPFPLTLILSDSDLPGSLLETKLNSLKWLAWQGSFILQK